MILLYEALDTTVILQCYGVLHEIVIKSSRMVSNAANSSTEVLA